MDFIGYGIIISEYDKSKKNGRFSQIDIKTTEKSREKY
jgi:hypothetical protein